MLHSIGANPVVILFSHTAIAPIESGAKKINLQKLQVRLFAVLACIDLLF
jgi:hypothetical protein